MTEGTFTLGRNAEGQLVFVRVTSASIEVTAKRGRYDHNTVRLTQAQAAELIEVLR